MALLSLVGLLTGCNATGTPLPGLVPEINSTYEAERMGILPGDTLEVRFTERTDWDHETVVQPDGSASFLHLGSLRVGGMSVDELKEKLSASYAATIRQHELAVFLKESSGRSITVMGAVDEPGVYPLTGGRLTLLEALARAGGVIEKRANLKDVYLVRWLPVEGRQTRWHIDARTEYWDDSDPVFLQPYDVVYVPQKTVVHVNDWIDQYIRQMIPFPYLIPPVVYQ